MASTVINLVLGVLVIAVAVLVIFAPQLMGVLATGLPAEKQAQAVLLVRLVLPAVLFLGLSAVTTALLYAQQRFALPAFAVALYNLGLIVVAVLFAGRLGVVSLALGLLVGALAQVALQLPGLRAMRYSLRLELNHPGVRQILALYAPVALGHGRAHQPQGELHQRGGEAHGGHTALAGLRGQVAVNHHLRLRDEQPQGHRGV